MSTTRQTPGSGYFGSYQTGAGTRWEWKATITLANGTKKVVHKRGYPNKTAANKALREALTASDKGTYAQPSKQRFADYLAVWLAGLQHSPQTTASYRKNVRLHVAPHLGSLPLSAITPQALSAHYRELEKSGRRDGKGQGLSPRTVRYIHTIISAALRDAVEAELLPRNPASKAKPPTAKQAKAPERPPWTAAQLGAFLGWAKDNSELYPAWCTLAYTGMRRGELLALRWQDINLAKGLVTIKRSAGLVRVKGEGARIEVGPTKTEKSARVIDIDPATVAVLKHQRAERGSLHLSLVQPEALVFGNEEGEPRHPEHFSRSFGQALKRCGSVPPIRLHDLRHTHATLLLSDGEPVKTVSERLGHASATITLDTYSHVLPGDQLRAANRFAALMDAAASN